MRDASDSPVLRAVIQIPSRGALDSFHFFPIQLISVSIYSQNETLEFKGSYARVDILVIDQFSTQNRRQKVET